jgi:hypothetical protein
VKSCGALVSDIILTDDIKQHVLDNLVYREIKQQNPQTVINQQINMFNHMQNVISQIDPLEKLNKVVRHYNTELVDFDQHVLNTFSDDIEALDQIHDSNVVQLNTDSLLSIINILTTMVDIDNLNVIYDTIGDKVKLYNEGQWKTFLFHSGMSQILQCLQDGYLNFYETYLLKKYTVTQNHRTRALISEYLKGYYRFLACTELIPFVYEKTDGIILDTLSEEYTLEETWYTKFKDIKDNLKASEMKRTMTQIGNIIKRNSKSNIVELNKKIMEMINVDDTFQKEVLNCIQNIMRVPTIAA